MTNRHQIKGSERTVAFRPPDDSCEWLDRNAIENSTTASELMRQILEDAIARDQSCKRLQTLADCLRTAKTAIDKANSMMLAEGKTKALNIRKIAV